MSLADRFQRWVDARSPECREFTLTQRNIYVLPTRWGGGYLALIVLLFFSGVNYQNSMMLALAFLSLAVLLTHILWTWRNLAGLHVAFREAEPGYAGQTATVVLRVTAASRGHMGIELGWPGTGWQRFDLAPAQSDDRAIICKLGRRGRFNPGRMLITTTLPFGLIRAWSWQRLTVPMWVWPRPEEGPCPLANDAQDARQGDVSHRSASGDELADLRAWQTGEPVTRVSWKHVAAHDQWLVRTLDQVTAQSCWLDLDHTVGDIEHRLAVLAWWVDQLSASGQVFGLRLGGLELAPDCSPVHRIRALNQLAQWGQAG